MGVNSEIQGSVEKRLYLCYITVRVWGFCILTTASNMPSVVEHGLMTSHKQVQYTSVYYILLIHNQRTIVVVLVKCFLWNGCITVV